MSKITRRDFGKASAGGLAAAALSSGFGRQAAAANDSITLVDWGSPWIDLDKEMAAHFPQINFTFELYQGGALTILPKIKAAWPNPPYDMICTWDPLFPAMIKEGWAETLTPDDIPNLKDVPEALIYKDDKGNWKNVPRSMGGMFFASSDRCPIEITKLEDLLDPRLEGQILWPSGALNGSLQVVALSLAFGGDEFNVETGWKFLTELAKSGNIGRISNTSSDILNSLTTGETSVTFADLAILNSVKQNQPMKFLTKTHESLRTFPVTAGWLILSSSKNKQAAKEYANFTISPENGSNHYKMVGEIPANTKAEHSAIDMQFTDEELKKFAYFVDWDYISSQGDAWVKRYETDIAPLL